VQGQRHGYWDFRRSWVLSHLLPWALLVDTFLVALFKIYWPLARGWTVVCDRFVVDILVDLMTGLGDDSFDAGQPGKLFFGLLPTHSRVVVIDLDSDLARQRCPELLGDRTHEQRRTAYLNIARRHGLPVVSSATAIDVTTAALMESLGASHKLQEDTIHLDEVQDLLPATDPAPEARLEIRPCHPMNARL
jgi:hypothetical protein